MSFMTKIHSGYKKKKSNASDYEEFSPRNNLIDFSIPPKGNISFLSEERERERGFFCM